MTTYAPIDMKAIRKGDRVALAADHDLTGTVRMVRRTAGEKWSGSYSYQYKIAWQPYVRVKWDRPTWPRYVQPDIPPTDLVMIEELPR